MKLKCHSGHGGLLVEGNNLAIRIKPPRRGFVNKDEDARQAGQRKPRKDLSQNRRSS